MKAETIVVEQDDDVKWVEDDRNSDPSHPPCGKYAVYMTTAQANAYRKCVEEYRKWQDFIEEKKVEIKPSEHEKQRQRLVSVAVNMPRDHAVHEMLSKITEQEIRSRLKLGSFAL